MSSKTVRCALMGWLLLVGANAHAAVRAWLEPDRINLGQTTMLNLETDDASARPEFSVLEQNFTLRGQSSGTQLSFVNGQRSMRVQYSVALEPKDEGVITIPALRVGNETTEPLLLTVAPASAGSAQSGDQIYIEVELGTENPYVQQAVTYTVRLYYAIPLLDGSIETGTPQNASLQQVGEDRRGTQDINGMRYNVFERTLLLVPEQSGALELPRARFRGHVQSNDVNAFFSGGQAVTAVGKAQTLNVRPRPAGAPTPWLPAHGLSLVRNDVAKTARAGEPLTVEITLTADGAMASQLPPLELPSTAGAQVFPEQPQSKDTVAGGLPVASLTRRFAIVPTRAGKLTVPGLEVAYWNTETDKVDSARLPPVEIDVAPGSGLPTASIAPASSVPNTPALVSSGVAAAPASASNADLRPWQWLSALLGIGLVLSLWWGWRREAPAVAVSWTPVGSGIDVVAAAKLRQALAASDLHDIANALQGAVAPPASNLGELRSRVGDAGQREALDALERTLWSRNITTADRSALLPVLRQAFKSGVRVASDDARGSENPLPPLYPQR
jgi:hypothetical protein